MLPSNYVKRGGSESVTIYGAVFNNDLEVVHSKATTIAECEKFHGSKYVLSSMGQNYKEVENDLLSGKCVLFSGTPCQVAAIKSFLNKKHSRKKWALINRLHLEGNSSGPHHFANIQPLG